MPRKVSDLSKFYQEKITVTPSGCWCWLAAKTRDGYAIVFTDKTRRAHRVIYKLLRGEIPNNLCLDHLCRNRSCVNPDHLEAVSIKENILRGKGLAAKNNEKLFCNKGHSLNKENTYINPRGHRVFRVCKICRRATGKIRRGKGKTS